MQRKLLAGAAIALAAVTGPATANHLWNNYHWNLTAPGTPVIPVRYNVASIWTNDGGINYITQSVADWEQPLGGYTDHLKTTTPQRDTSLSRSSCTPNTGEIVYCSDTYGNNGWLGIAGIYASGSHISQGYVKLNDTYFAIGGSYDTYSDRALVACQEVGHTFGLGHQNENFNTDATTSCMEYTSWPEGNEHPDLHDWEALDGLYTAHFAEGSSGGGGKPGKGGGGGGGGKGPKGKPFSDPMAFREVGETRAAQAGDHPVFGTPVGYDAHGRPNVFEKPWGARGKHITHVTWVPGYEPEGTHHDDGHTH